MRAGKEVPHVRERVGGALLVVGGAYRLAKDLDLLLHVQAEHLLPDLLALGKRRQLAVEAVVQLVLHKGGEARSHGNLRELGNGARHRGRLEQHPVAETNLAQVVGLKRHRAHALLQAPSSAGSPSRPSPRSERPRLARKPRHVKMRGFFSPMLGSTVSM